MKINRDSMIIQNLKIYKKLNKNRGPVDSIQICRYCNYLGPGKCSSKNKPPLALMLLCTMQIAGSGRSLPLMSLQSSQPSGDSLAFKGFCGESPIFLTNRCYFSLLHIQLEIIVAMAGQQLLTEVSKITELQSIRVAIKESFKGAAIVGFSALIGSLMFGPRGLAFGGALGGLSAAAMSETYKSVPEIILHDLTEQQQNELVASIYAAVKSIPIHEVADFAARMSQDRAVAATVAMTVISYLNSLPGMEIQD